MKKSKRHSRLVEHLEGRTLLSFSIVSIPDTQYLVEQPGAPVMNAQVNWILNNATAANIQFVAQEGDLLRRGYSNFQAQNADTAFAKLNNLVPYTLDIGNHDYDNQFDDLNHHISSANFTQWFGDARYEAISDSGFGGSSLDQQNRYQIFTADGQQYMVLSLEWEATDSALAWAQGVINAHRQLPVILTTHEYLGSTGRTSGPLDPLGNDGNGIFTKLVQPNPQIFLVMSGHTGANFTQTSQDAAGLPVIEMVGDDAGVGRFQLFNFSPNSSNPAQGKITLTTYSPSSALTDTSLGQTTFTFNFSTRFAFASGTIANDDTLTTPENAPIIGNVLSNDVGGNLSVAAYTNPANGTLSWGASGAFTYTPKANYYGNDTFTYTLSGGNTAKVAVQVNSAPTANPDTASTSEGKAIVVNVVSNDTDPDTGTGIGLAPILTTLPPHGAVFANADGTLTYTPDPKWTGTDTFTYVASDGDSISALPATVSVTVSAVPANTIAYDYPIGETTTTGTRTGTYANLTATDGTLETIAESSSRVLDQRWQFNVTGGTEVTACINAWRASGADEYALSYSTNGTTWSNMTQIVPASSLSVTRIGTPLTYGTTTPVGADPGEPYQMWLLPASTKGTVWIRATQTAKTYTVPSSLAVDELFIRSTGVTPVVVPNAPSNLTSSYNSKTRKATLSWKDNSSNETGFHMWYSTNNGTTWQVYSTLAANTTSLTTSALTQGLTYLFAVSAFNSAGDSALCTPVKILA
ncbi:MAG: Ig-like domain-containing protein [Tepidisphaeraceae bacterium]|jgi:hypothetical protein